MSGKTLSVPSTATLAEAARTMVTARVGSALVIDDPWLVGIITERDALRAVADGADPAQARVSDWMTPEPVTAGPDTDSEDAATLMAAQGFRHLPVVDGTTVLGIVSLRDVLSTRIRRPPG